MKDTIVFLASRVLSEAPADFFPEAIRYSFALFWFSFFLHCPVFGIDALLGEVPPKQLRTLKVFGQFNENLSKKENHRQDGPDVRWDTIQSDNPNWYSDSNHSFHCTSCPMACWTRSSRLGPNFGRPIILKFERCP